MKNLKADLDTRAFTQFEKSIVEGEMGEGVAIGLDAMKRATVVGTGMAGLNDAVFDLQLPNSTIKLNYAAEKLFHINGTPREDFVPPVLVSLTGKNTDDPILDMGIRTLRALL